MCDGEMLFVLFAAAGSPMARADTVETAMEIADERGLEFITVH
jgi:hypothetical protein